MLVVLAGTPREAGQNTKGTGEITMRSQSLSTMLRRSALRHGAKPAIICGATRWSYAELDTLADTLANGLTAPKTHAPSPHGAAPHALSPHGAAITKGDRIAILARNSAAFVALRFAAARMGAVLVPINFMLNAADVRYILDHSGARLLFVDATTLATAQAAIALEPGSTIEALYGLPGEHDPAPTTIPSYETLFGPATPPGDCPPDDQIDADTLLQIIYTSGTESRPKGAMLTHGAVMWQYHSCIVDSEWRQCVTVLHAMPLFHCAQLDAKLGPGVMMGACNVITGNPAPENILRLLEAHRAEMFFGPPTVWISLLRCPAFDSTDLSALTQATYGASIMPGAVLAEIQQRLPHLRLWNFYGQTEIAPVATVLHPHEHAARPSSCGRAVLHVTTRVVDEDMHDVKPTIDGKGGEIGEVVHRSPHLMLGYWRDPERTAEAFAGGWFHSGDLATIDEEGYITIVDRKKDIIKTGGENVSSREVEEAMYRHPAVAEVAVVGLPDPRWVEAVTAFITLRPGEAATEADLLTHGRQHLSHFKAPKRVVLVDSLPRNASGKLLKRDLRSL